MQISIRNNTPSPVEIVGAGEQHIVLAPLEIREFPKDEVDGFDLSQARREGLLSDWTTPSSDVMEKLLGVLFTFGFLIVIGCGVVASRETPGGFATRGRFQLSVWITGLVVLLLIVGGVAIYQTRSLRLVGRFLAQSLSLLITLVIGFGVPAATVYFFGGGRALLAESSPRLFARLLQVSFIATASLLPVLLFFIFDRFRLNTLRSRLYRDLFRLDRGLKTRSQIDAKYGSQILEAFGSEEEGRGRLAPGTRWPVLVCGFVVAMGWLIVFKPVGDLTAEAAQRPLSPEQSALTFGFLGAYFFGLQLIARRYARGDLKPKAYGYVMVRILIVAVLSWVLEVIFRASSTAMLLSAFLIGILPDEFFTLLREKFRSRDGSRKSSDREQKPGRIRRALNPVISSRMIPEAEKHPLTKLEGIDLYDRARLEQEGIVNVESFAHHDFIHLVLETQLPVPRLVDWMDQAILYLHVIEPDGDDSNDTRKTLRQYGIRTATDLLACWTAAKARGEVDEFKRLLGGEAPPFRLEVIRDAMLDDEWLKRVQSWRDDAELELLRVMALPTSFAGKLNWARDLKEKGKYKDAVKTYLQAIEIQDDPEARIELAKLLATVPVDSLRSQEQSRKHAARAFELGRDDGEIVIAVLEVSEANEDFADALRACERVIELIGDPKRDKSKRLLLERLKVKRESLREKGELQRVADGAPAAAAAIAAE